MRILRIPRRDSVGCKGCGYVDLTRLRLDETVIEYVIYSKERSATK